ncbi:hypothetical protein LG198_00045 [Methylobacillus arboreus]|uniref:hypothetical protein n=1 Tax=Methylobacillus arboreus TaxID=755170 RepID=UPI001E2F923F|nr:hypothetical protein [Methylobacillus arboreus]MCB5189123.1 hypothetical protein [Methylobacillus arboreus]
MRFYLFAGLLGLAFNLQAADSSESVSDAKVGFIEDENSECLANDGKLILLKSDATETMVVWLDRWFMGVRTADHTKHVLKPGDEPIALGCSQTRDKEKQYWTIASAQAQ